MGAIDVGQGANSDLGGNATAGWTRVDLANPANDTGILTSVEIWARSGNAEGAKAGTFSGSGTTYGMRDFETIGTVVQGAKRTFTGLNIDVVTGDYLGCYCSAGYGYFSAAFSGYTGIYQKSGDYFSPGDNTYTFYSGDATATYATGATTPPPGAWTPRIIIIT